MTDFTWKSGTVVGLRLPDLPPERLDLRVGQVWDIRGCLLTVVSLTPEGEVQLRPEGETSAAKAAALFPDEEWVKGKAGACPFKKVDERMARTDKRLRVGDFLLHEAWSCWAEMLLFQG